MDLQSLTLLVEIIDCGNLSQVARKFNMTRANVSYHLSQLEKSVGAQLVRRTTRRVEATEVGLRLYEHGRNIQNEILAARETVEQLGQGLQGRVGISVPSGFGDLVMADWLIEFKHLYPGIVLDVLFENRTDHLRDEVDLAIRVMNEPPPSLVARRLGDVRCIVCASREYAEAHGMPRTPQELCEAPIISVGALGRQIRMCAEDATTRHEVVLEPTLISDHFPFLRKGILAGLGVGLVPDYVLPDKLASGEIVTALDDYRLSIYGEHMYLLYMPSRHRTKAMRTCIDFLLEKAGAAQPASGHAP
ncbi:MAG: LysR family transcriptional regulator [Comamonas sp.]